MAVRRGQGPQGANQGLYYLQQVASQAGLGQNPYLTGGFDADKRPQGIGSYGDLMQAYDWFRSRGLDYVSGRHTDASGKPVNAPNVPMDYDPTSVAGVYKTRYWIDPNTLTGAGLKYGGTGLKVPHRADLSLSQNPLYAAAIAAHPEGAAAIGDFGPVTADNRVRAAWSGFGQGKSGVAASGDTFVSPAAAATKNPAAMKTAIVDTSLPAATRTADVGGLASLLDAKPAAVTVEPMATKAVTTAPTVGAMPSLADSYLGVGSTTPDTGTSQGSSSDTGGPGAPAGYSSWQEFLAALQANKIGQPLF